MCGAIGYSEASGIPMRMGLIRNHYVGRTFIEPQQSIRHFGVRVKLNPCEASSKDSVVLVDDPPCAARPAARSSAWFGARVRGKCTCASAVRRLFRRVSMESIHLVAPS